jgi:hypothetical protein
LPAAAFALFKIFPAANFCKLGIPDDLVTFQVMRRTLGTDMQQHGTLKNTQGRLHTDDAAREHPASGD